MYFLPDTKVDANLYKNNNITGHFGDANKHRQLRKCRFRKTIKKKCLICDRRDAKFERRSVFIVFYRRDCAHEQTGNNLRESHFTTCKLRREKDGHPISSLAAVLIIMRCDLLRRRPLFAYARQAPNNRSRWQWQWCVAAIHGIPGCQNATFDVNTPKTMTDIRVRGRSAPSRPLDASKCAGPP